MNPRGYTRNFCDSCVADKEIGVPGHIEWARLHSVYVTKGWQDELNRRQILPVQKPGGGYYIGRRMENGSISESRKPDDRPYWKERRVK